MKGITSRLILLAMCLFFESGLYSKSKIRIGLLTYPPYVNGPSLSDGGIVVGLLEDSGVLNRKDVKVYILPPQRAWNEYKEKRLDLVLASKISQSKKTLATNHFFQIFNGDTYLFYHRVANAKGCFGPTPIQGNPTVAVIRGVESEKDNLTKNGYKVFEVDSPTQGIKMLSNQRIDFLHMSMVPIKVILKKYFRNNEARNILASTCRYLSNPVGFLHQRQASKSVRKIISNIKSILTDDEKIRRSMRKTIDDNSIINDLILKTDKI